MKKSKGFSMTFAIISATLALLIIFVIVKIMQFSSHQMAYMEVMDKVFAMAETGLSQAVDKLAVDPAACDNHPFMDEGQQDNGKGRYTMTCEIQKIPYQSIEVACYYIVASATYTINGHSYIQRLHNYVEISNVSKYLFAVNSDFPVAYDTQAPLGRIFGKRLYFDKTGTPRSNSFLKAEFSEQLDPPLNLPPGCDDINVPCTAWDAASSAGITLAEPVLNKFPVRIAQLRFPIITEKDAANYSFLAAGHTQISHFNDHPEGGGCSMTDIYPPGYTGAQAANDCYSPTFGRSTNNREHVYYSSNDIHIGITNGSTVTIHGQVIFFTTNSIYIDGNIVSAPDTAPLPGAGQPSSSTAHQAVFIAGPGKDIWLTDNFYNTAKPNTSQVLTVHGVLFATSGSLLSIGGKSTPNYETLHSSGSVIVGSIGNIANTFADNYNGNPARVYTYMQSLITNPPPYLPVFIVIYNQFQEIVNSPSMY